MFLCFTTPLHHHRRYHPPQRLAEHSDLSLLKMQQLLPASSGLCASYVPTEATAQQAQTDKSAGLVAWNLSERSKEPVMLADTYRQRRETLLVNLLKLLTNDWAMTSQLSQLKAGLPRAIHQRFVATSTQ